MRWSSEFETLAHALSDLDPASPQYAAAADRYSHVEGRLRHHDVYALDAQVGGVLTGLGFVKEDWTRRTEEFSGGWQMRIALAKLLLEKPDLLLLDEPTNHLDLETRNWLENYLSTWPNGYILISHDRYFLDVTVNKIIEIWNKALHVYHGNYEKYLQQKAERRAQLESAYRNQREHIDHLEAFISRFRYQATKAKQVQSRIKELDKIERIEIPLDEPAPHFSFPQPPPSGRTVVEVAGLSMQYGEKRVLENVSFTIERGDRIALVGVNGAGKSTLIRLLSGQEMPTTGALKLGHNVVAEYFAQDQYKVLDPAARMLEDIGRAAPKVAEKDLRSLLGCFLFSGDDVFKPLGVLSGGERNRYALARILVSPANFLLLDEPDEPPGPACEGRASGGDREIYRDGDFCIARSLLHRRPGAEGDSRWSGIWRIHRAARGSMFFPGTTKTIYGARKEERRRWLSATTAAAKLVVEAVAIALPEPVAAEKVRRVNPIKLRQMQERLAAVEAEIPRVEGWVAETEQALGVYVSTEETQRLSEVLAVLREQQASLTSEWEELSMQLEEN